MTPIAIDANKTVSKMVLSVRLVGRRRFAMRCWISAALVRIAGFVLGSQVSISIDLTDPGLAPEIA